MGKSIAVYCGSFDPPTNGHIWVAQRATNLFNEVHVMIGYHPGKEHTFKRDERIQLLKDSMPEGVVVGSLDGLTPVQYVENNLPSEDSYAALIRGLRGPNDYVADKGTNDYMRDRMKIDNIEFIYLMPPKELEEVSSSRVKEECEKGNWHNVQRMVSPAVFEALAKIYIDKVCDEDVTFANYEMNEDMELVKDHFYRSVESGLINFAEEIDCHQVRRMLDPVPVDLVVSEKFKLLKIDVEAVKPIGDRFVPCSRSVGPIIVEANHVIGNNTPYGHLGDAIVIEGKHRLLDAIENGYTHLWAWVGDKVNVQNSL